MPKVSVLLPIYNAENHLQECLSSLFSQSYQDFEILAIDDGSKDRSLEILDKIRDPRLKVLRNPKNLGISDTLNRAIEYSNGVYLARMDADDIAKPGRLEKQVKYLDEHPEVDVLGSWYRLFGATAPQVIENPVDDNEIKAGLIFDSVIGHPTVMIRGNSLKRLPHVYDPQFNRAEDFELWTRASDSLVFANLPEVLLDYRIHENQTGSLGANAQRAVADRVRIQYLEKLGIRLSEPSKAIHLILAHYDFGKVSPQDYPRVESYLQEILGDRKPEITDFRYIKRALIRHFSAQYYRDYLNFSSRAFIKKNHLLDYEAFSLSKKIFWVFRSFREALSRLKNRHQIKF